jgi:hypothetical protein
MGDRGNAVHTRRFGTFTKLDTVRTRSSGYHTFDPVMWMLPYRTNGDKRRKQ